MVIVDPWTPGFIGERLSTSLGVRVDAPFRRPAICQTRRPVGYAFLSYARADQAYVRRLAKAAKARGIDTWYDTEIESGARWADVIDDKVHGCGAFTPVLTSASVASDWCKRELQRADELNKPILPLVFRGTEVPLLLIDRQHETVTSAQLPTDRWFETLASKLHGPSSSAGRPEAAPAWLSSGSPDNMTSALESMTPTAMQRKLETAAAYGPVVASLDEEIFSQTGRAAFGSDVNDFYSLLEERLSFDAPLSPALQEVLDARLASSLVESPVIRFRARRLRKRIHARPEYRPGPLTRP